MGLMCSVWSLILISLRSYSMDMIFCKLRKMSFDEVRNGFYKVIYG